MSDRSEPSERGSGTAGLLETREIFKGRTVHLVVDRVRLPNDKVMNVELVHHKGAVAVVPLMGDDVLMVRQYRHATGGWLLEIPAGTLEPGEAPEACALRETEEETGHRPAELESLGWIWPTPGFCDEKIWLFLARGLVETQQGLDEDEVLELERIPLKDAIAKAASGELNDGKSICALLRVAHRLGMDGG